MKKLLIVIALLAVVLTHTNCNKSDDNTTIVLLGTEHYVKPIAEFIPGSLQTTIDYRLGTMPEGFFPCCVEGEYVISPTKFCYSNFVDLSNSNDIHFRISNQHNRVAKVEINEGGTVVTDTAYLMGHGQFFTLYLKEIRQQYKSSAIERSVIIKGEKTDDGIKDLMIATIVLDASQGQNPFVGSFIPGWYFIYKDQDGLAENCDWFDNN